MSKIASTSTSWWESAFWWAVTLVILILMDDLISGPVFWVISIVNPVLSTVLAFAISLTFQVWVTRAGMSQEPKRVAQFFINRLMLARKSGKVVEREESLQSRITSTVSAVLMSLVVGGVLPVLLLHKKGRLGEARLRRLTWLTAAVYATEFALIHGGYGLGAVVRGLWGWLL